MKLKRGAMDCLVPSRWETETRLLPRPTFLPAYSIDGKKPRKKKPRAQASERAAPPSREKVSRGSENATLPRVMNGERNH